MRHALMVPGLIQSSTNPTTQEILVKNCPTERIRNFVLAGQAGAGKTSLSDLILFKGGAVSRQGSVDAGTSVSDFRKEEQDRKSSIYSAILNTAWKDGHFFC